MSDFLPIWPKNFGLKFNRYFDGGRESIKLSFEPLLEKVVFVGIPTIYHVTNTYVFYNHILKIFVMVHDHEK